MSLNKKQQAIVDFIRGQALVVACPGSGKTTTMIARAKAIIDSGVDPSSILIMTFTKEAAENMQKKFESQYGKTTIRFGTIHSICFQALRELKGYSEENIITEAEKWDFFGKILKKKVPKNEMEEFIKGLITEISFVKNCMCKSTEYVPEVCSIEDFCKCYKAYEIHKRKEKKIDFDDMLLVARQMFLNDDAITETFHKKYPYIMVDEFQDTNFVQADIIYRNVGKDGNLCVVGDDDQSIYGFRSADSTIMLDFPKKYPNCKIFHLDTNYRSEPEIIEYANRLIKHNTIRFDKKFESFKTGEAEVVCQKHYTTIEQCTKVVQMIEYLHQTKKVDYQDIAVLYRTNRENQLMISKLLKHNIDFYTTESIHDHHSEKAFLDILCYYRLSQNNEKPGDLQDILNRPSRYLKTEAFKDCKFQKEEMLERCEYLKNRSKARIAVNQMFKDIEQLSKKNPSDFIQYLYYIMDYRESYVSYMEYLGKTRPEAEDVLNTLEEEASNFSTMEEWVNYAKTYVYRLRERSKSRKGICLSTYHASKGLEWDNVFLLNCNEGYAPYRKAETKEQIEEERRLFYVAFTRAKKNVYLSYTEENGKKQVAPSRFLKEMKLISNTAEQSSKRTRIQSTITPKEKSVTVDEYYAVRVGKKPGVYASEIAAKKQMFGVRDAEYKKFSTYDEAKAWLGKK